MKINTIYLILFSVTLILFAINYFTAKTNIEKIERCCYHGVVLLFDIAFFLAFSLNKKR